MLPYNWPVDYTNVIQEFETKYGAPEASALLSFAVWAVDSLYYLSHLDDEADYLHQRTIKGHRSDVVDVAHARWATTTCITALDLCAAGLGRVFALMVAAENWRCRIFILMEKPST